MKKNTKNAKKNVKKMSVKNKNVIKKTRNMV